MAGNNILGSMDLGLHAQRRKLSTDMYSLSDWSLFLIMEIMWKLFRFLLLWHPSEDGVNLVINPHYIVYIIYIITTEWKKIRAFHFCKSSLNQKGWNLKLLDTSSNPTYLHVIMSSTKLWGLSLKLLIIEWKYE